MAEASILVKRGCLTHVFLDWSLPLIGFREASGLSYSTTAAPCSSPREGIYYQIIFHDFAPPDTVT